ncbi:MAG: prealbumin-like fold domain-containing protein [Defluviitaleaceae bacterium]|nr:prealbumin-like fold domain-containing protein [Defluviitaleaceae bacterium]
MKKLKLMLVMFTVSFFIMGWVMTVWAQEGGYEDDVGLLEAVNEGEAVDALEDDQDRLIEAVEDDVGGTGWMSTQGFFSEEDRENAYIWYDEPDRVVTLAATPAGTAYTRLRQEIIAAPAGEITHIIIPFHINTGDITGNGVTNTAGSGSVVGIRPGATVVLIGQHQVATTSIIEPNDRRIVITDTNGLGVSRMFRVRGDGDERTALVFRNIVLQNGSTGAQGTPANPPAPLALASQTAAGGTRGGSVTIENGSVTAGAAGGSVPNGTLISPGGGGHVVFCRGTVIRNTSSDNNSGAVELQLNGRFTMQEGAQIINNAAHNSGGGVGLTGGNAIFNMHGGVIEENFARLGGPGGGGGGVLLGNGTAIFNMHGGVIRGNRAGVTNAAGMAQADDASRNGGGVRVFNGTFNWYGGDIYNNSASNGGGISVANGTVNMDRSRVLRENVATGGGVLGVGGGVHVTGGYFHLHAGEITANAANTVGGGIAVLGGQVIVHGGEIHANRFIPTTGGSGGGVYIRDGEFRLAGGSIHDHGGEGNQTVVNGGGVFLSGGSLVMTDGDIHHNTVTGHGGGIGVTGTGVTAIHVRVEGGHIHHNTAGGFGGGVGITRTAAPDAAATAALIPIFNMTGGEVSNNLASQFPGIHFAPVVNNTIAGTVESTLPNNNLNVSGTAIIDALSYVPNVTQTKNGTTGNTSNTMTLNIGGEAEIGLLIVEPLLAIQGTGTTAARENSFQFNLSDQALIRQRLVFDPTLTSSGGTGGESIRANTLNFTMSGGTLGQGVDFVPSMISGGGATTGTRNNQVTFTISGGVIYGTTVQNGGGINYQPHLQVASGGAVAQRSNVFHLNLDGGVIREGVATSNGGGVFHLPVGQVPPGTTEGHSFFMRMRDATVEDNRAIVNGGGIFVSFQILNGTTSIPIVNMSEESGENQPRFERVIRNNIAGGDGGGLYLDQNINLPLIMNDVIVTGNRAESGNGGGIFVWPTGENRALTMNNSRISDNVSFGNGASLWNNRGHHLTMNNSHLDRNTTLTGEGGGLHFNPNDTGPASNRVLTLNGTSTINDNEAPGAADGGGLFAERATITLNDESEMSGNRTTGRGGGLFAVDTIFNLYGESRMNGNSAGEGGGIAATGTTINFHDESRMNGNSAGEGGGIAATDTTINLHDESRMNGNSAEEGGGITATGTTINLHDESRIDGNSAGEGGGITATGTTINLHDESRIDGNDAQQGGGIAATNTTIHLYGESRIDGNDAGNGGGISGVDATIHLNDSSQISDNDAGNGGGIFATNTTVVLRGESQINRNQSDHGGGIFAINGTIQLENGMIGNNRSFGNGGGVFLSSGSHFYLVDGWVSGNVAVNGGGFYVEESAYLTATHGQIVNNAADAGGGIFSERYEDTAILTESAYNHLFLTEALIFEGNSAFFSTVGPVNPELIHEWIPTTLASSIPDTHVLNHYDINYPNETFAEFIFFKMDELMYTDFEHATFLSGAVFDLFYAQGDQWVFDQRMESDEFGRVVFTSLRLNTTYRLVEVGAPAGYRLPQGDWLIAIDETGYPTITAQGDNVLAFMHHEDQFYLGNLKEFELPILGGLGLNETLVFAGLSLMISACCLFLIVKRYQKKRR